MKKLKIIGLLCTILASGIIAACANPLKKNSSNEESTSTASFSESLIESSSFDLSSEESSKDSSMNDSSQSDSSSNEDSSSSEEDELDEEAIAIVDAAYGLNANEYLDGTYTLTGTVTEIATDYTSKNGVCLSFVVKGRETKPMYCFRLKGSGADVIGVGDTITVSGQIKNYQGSLIEFDKGCQLIAYELSGEQDDKPIIGEDPYENVSKYEFYMDYSSAESYEDAYYRSLHGFMSGELTVPDQAPTLSKYQPMKGETYIRNADMLYEDDGNTYIVVDAYGYEAFRVYKGGAYITLEEVAAYVYAFGTYPENYTTSKNTKPSESVWGKYLRVNHTGFSGSTSKYPYEPELPNISGCGGKLSYFEMDIGTTGTDCDPSYPIEIYNDGYSITRGAARIVYGKTDLNGNGKYEIGELHVFYTYNHYNDFQEYLNYEGGWGEMFGNITGGGTLSSKYDCNPTDYVEVSIESLPEVRSVTAAVEYACFLNKREDFL